MIVPPQRAVALPPTPLPALPVGLMVGLRAGPGLQHSTHTHTHTNIPGAVLRGLIYDAVLERNRAPGFDIKMIRGVGYSLRYHGYQPIRIKEFN